MNYILIIILLQHYIICQDNVNPVLAFNLKKQKKRSLNNQYKHQNLFVSRVYSDIFTKEQIQKITQLPQTHELEEGIESSYQTLKKIGAGGFSQVYLGQSISSGDLVVLKFLKDMKEITMIREIAILNYLKGSSPYIVQIRDAIKNPSEKNTTIIYDFTNSVSLRKLAKDLPFEELKRYLFQLLLALDMSHSKGVIHRDIKLGNTVVNVKTKTLQLIDWGLADFYYPMKIMNCGVGTIHYKAPELFLGYKYYDYAADMWSFGVILAGQVFGKNPLFKAQKTTKNETRINYLREICKYLGTNNLNSYIKKYGIEITKTMIDKVGQQVIFKNNFKRFEPINLFQLKRRSNITSPLESIDLISKLLVFDHRVRLTAKEAMNHPFFDSIRSQFAT